ncbi:metallophosphoesterase [uncultured Ruminococcus sp.]|uniref:metallophosphoesterase n=1 Tax=uncultured Ruminococcus sp. TaxID=165186 RepID=UPI00261C0433|nr:metallophosphoesterase [uncultured Ruminococcus sp.]
MEKKRRRFITVCLLMMIAVVLEIAGYDLEMVTYQVNTGKLDKPVRIVFISDLHNSVYGGTDQSGLIDEIHKAEPDIIIFGGDMINSSGSTKNALTLVRKTAAEYPCYYSPGNHEMERGDRDEFFREMSELGVNVLMGSWADIEIRGSNVRIFGVVSADYHYQLRDCKKGLDKKHYNVLIAHEPQEIDSYLTKRGEPCFNLILSGHAHGGQWRIPKFLDQGIYAPDQGLFPDYTNGIYDYGGTVHIISCGLAKPFHMLLVPRIFNRPELSIIDAC